MQPSSGSVDDDERQVAVLLQLKTFLCNNANGMTKSWGVIVAAKEYANGLFSHLINNVCFISFGISSGNNHLR